MIVRSNLLLPDAVDDWVGADNPVRSLDAFVDGLDLERAGFERLQANGTRRMGYDPADLLKLYLYGYLDRIRSSRCLEAESDRNLEVIWLQRRLRPDFKTIADFRRDNREAFRQVFREFVRLCRELDLYGRAFNAPRLEGRLEHPFSDIGAVVSGPLSHGARTSFGAAAPTGLDVGEGAGTFRKRTNLGPVERAEAP